MAETVLTELAREVRELCASAEMNRRKRMWETLFRGEQPERPVVKCAPFMGPWYDIVWQRLIPEDSLHFKDGPARRIEIQLRKKIVKFRELRDDDVIMPTVWVFPKPVIASDDLWGLKIERTRTGDEGGAYKEVPPIREEADLDRVTIPRFAKDDAADRALIAEARELIGGLLPVKLYGNQISLAPYEFAVLLRGAEQLLYDVYDRPEFVHRLMARLTEGTIAYYNEREAAGSFDFEETRLLHEPWDPPPAGTENRLRSGWGYVSAQSAASLGPEMYAEFVHPYHVPIAKLFWKIYYHGCEDLGKKVASIKDLPNLMHFHVSPWTELKDVRPHLDGRKLAIELHAHPTNVLFVWGEKEIRAEARRRMSEAKGMAFDYVLCDLQTIDGADGKLQLWCDLAMEEAHRQGS